MATQQQDPDAEETGFHFSEECDVALVEAIGWARETRAAELAPEFVLLALLADRTPARVQRNPFVAAQVLASLGTDPLKLIDQLIDTYVGATEAGSAETEPKLGDAMVAILGDARAYAEYEVGPNAPIWTVHILAALLDDPEIKLPVLARLRNADITSFTILRRWRTSREHFAGGEPVADDEAAAEGPSSPHTGFATDLTAIARAGELDPVIGREREIDRLITILGRRTKNNPALLGEPGTGKAQPLYAKLKTPTGWTTMGLIEAGDKVVTPDGRVASVLATFPQGERLIYRLHFADGRTADADGEHLWRVYGPPYGPGKQDRLREWQTITTVELLKRLQITKAPWTIALAEAVEISTQEELPLPAYLLGALLGDGNFTSASVRFSNMDEELLDRVRAALAPDYVLKKASPGNHTRCDYRINGAVQLRGRGVKGIRRNQIAAGLVDLGLFGRRSWEKFIPDAYKNAPIADRIALLSALIDTDGHVSDEGSIYYTTTSPQLAADIQEVVRSLGGLASVSEKHPTYVSNGQRIAGRTRHKINIRLRNPRMLNLIERKQSRLPENYQYVDQLKLRVLRIERLGMAEARCILIDHPEHLYITDNYVVTHNTAIAEGLAQRIAAGKVPARMRRARVMALSMANLVANTQYRGQFEARVSALIAEMKAQPDTIIFIDELHSIVGAGSGGGNDGNDFANMLKPALARGELRCIGATTLDEYRRYIERDAALERRFQPVMVDEPDEPSTRAILDGLVGRYAAHHEVTYTPAALDACVKLAGRHIANRRFPDKAIDLMDEVGSRVSARAASTVQASDVATLVAEIVKLPASELDADGAHGNDLEQALAERVLGQGQAVELVTGTLRVRRMIRRRGSSAQRGPLASLALIGPDGVGKSTIAHSIADALFGGRITEIDLSNYAESHSISGLIGAPAGYVGYGERARLVEPLRNNPAQVVLLKHVDRAHPAVRALLVDVLRSGQVADSSERIASYRDAVVVFTMARAQAVSRSIGFGSRGTAASLDAAEAAGAVLRDSVGEELVSLVDAVVPLRALLDDDMAAIRDARLRSIVSELRTERIELAVGPRLSEELLTLARRSGARGINRAIEHLVEQPLAADMPAPPRRGMRHLLLEYNNGRSVLTSAPRRRKRS